MHTLPSLENSLSIWPSCRHSEVGAWLVRLSVPEEPLLLPLLLLFLVEEPFVCPSPVSCRRATPLARPSTSGSSAMGRMAEGAAKASATAVVGGSWASAAAKQRVYLHSEQEGGGEV